MQKIFTLSQKIQDDVVGSLERLSDSLVPDVSSYAKGRLRFWFEHEAPLSQKKSWRDGVHDPHMWSLLNDIWAKSHMRLSLDLGLAAYGPIGIIPHRDAEFAHQDTLLLNFGKANFRYARSRGDNDFDDYELSRGEVYRFDSKHLHASTPVEDDRWVIILWHCKIPMPAPAKEEKTLDEFFDLS